MIGRERPGEQSEVAQLIQQTLEQERWQREMMEQRYAQYGEDDEEVRDSWPGCQPCRPLVAAWRCTAILCLYPFPRPWEEAQSTTPYPRGAPVSEG